MFAAEKGSTSVHLSQMNEVKNQKNAGRLVCQLEP